MAKRNKAGSIYPRPGSPYLWIKFYVPGEKEPIRESTKTADLNEAQKYLHRRLGETATGKFYRPGPGALKVSELFDWVLEDYVNNGRTSIKALRSHLKHLRPFFGHQKAATRRRPSNSVLYHQAEARRREKRFYQPRVGSTTTGL